jgi:intermediate peptidase
MIMHCNLQVLYALIDMTLFGKQPLPAKDTTAVIADLKLKHTGVRHVEGTHWHTRFNHLVRYASHLLLMVLHAFTKLCGCN